MLDLVQSAINKERNTEFTFYLSGDLNQMSIQRSFLNGRGIETKQNDVYPCLRSSDVERALTLIWKFRVEGWWHYMEQYKNYNICTEDEFMNRLRKS